MIIVKEEQPKETYIEPVVLTARNVQYYCHHTQELISSQVRKARKFVEANCIDYSPKSKCFFCMPLKGYNTRTYTLQKIGDTFHCNCQGFQKKLRDGQLIVAGANCPHILALYFSFKMRRFKNE